MEHRRDPPVASCDEASPFVVAAQQKLFDIVLRVFGEAGEPQRAELQLLLGEPLRREFRLQEKGVVGEFRLPQPFQSQILLAVDEGVVRRQVLREETVYHREGAVVAGVGLLDVDAEGFVVDGRSDREGHELLPDEERASAQFQLPEVVECPLHGALFGRQFGRMAVVAGAPFTFEAHAFGGECRRQFLVTVVVGSFEPVDMVAFGLVAPSREVAQVVGAVDVILVVAVAPDAEFGMGAAHGCGPFGRKSRNAQRLSRGAGVGFETGDEVREIALAQRLHVADVMAAVDVEADQQKTLLDAPCAAVGAFPAVHVGEGQIAVADARRAGEAFDGGLVFEPHGSEFHRIIRR